MAPAKRKTKPAKSDPRQAKLDAILQDFDAEVKSRVLQLKEEQRQLLKDLDNSYTMALIKLPMAVRQMNFLLYFASKKSTSDDENTAPQNTAKKAKSKRPPVASKKTRAQSVSKGNAATRMSTRKPLITPARNMLDSSLMIGATPLVTPRFDPRSTRKPLITPARNMLDSSLMIGATPLVTPRFDPRLPKTPGVRVPRHRERVYSISVNGSPIDSSAKDIVINVPVGNGESIQLLASQMDSVDLSSLDETALQSIRNLQSRLTTLCEQRE
ncbi:hypothetical protein NHX12_023671 [Muraenolepis orangiensis]|uniref:Borealin n=1 Tax=Muraenolepis orangiensis TaxID=630683 RepID=A0A9Q0IQ83_9TELE|nr:hypothetical protein NHX12_023671 [Muraenolepis orangiensis]